ncbi:unnamed protein product [Heligmosomoides polygyrus]|uniref:Uncharacterized protein n=1 Tax=Heligmosomoides polygyrus TaxID=6339 RepID=A0A183GRK5_HELPZ|nr:unnamed protein product [Heligmosomoides polygyrus]
MFRWRLARSPNCLLRHTGAVASPHAPLNASVLRDRQKNDGIFDRDEFGDGSMTLLYGKNAESSAADTLVRRHADPLKPIEVCGCRREAPTLSESSSNQSSRNSITLWTVL